MNETLLEHSSQLEAENRQQRKQEFPDRDPDKKIDCPYLLPNFLEGNAAADVVTLPDHFTI